MRKGMPVVLLIKAVEEAEDAQPRAPAQVAEQLAHRIGKPVVSSDGPGQLGFTYQLFDAIVAGTEGDVALTAPVFRINGSEGAIRVSYSVKSGTATEGKDFVMSGTLSWADGETAAKRIRTILKTHSARAGRLFASSCAIQLVEPHCIRVPDSRIASSKTTSRRLDRRRNSDWPRPVRKSARAARSTSLSCEAAHR